ncbi:MAG: hypothetical protein HYV47_03985 [Candidatus Nealsonbacteria bacterium]|nr:hypothetical protein [Candidatus Nealsonbacteria bacterium]
MSEEKEKKNIFKEFIEQLDQIDDLAKDRDVQNVDEALTKWIQTNYPKGFEFDYNRRDLMIKMIKKSAEISDLIMKSKLRTYLDAIIAMRWQQIADEETERAKRAGRTLNQYNVLMKFAREIFVLGYCLRSLEKEIEKDQQDKDKK